MSQLDTTEKTLSLEELSRIVLELQGKFKKLEEKLDSGTDEPSIAGASGKVQKLKQELDEIKHARRAEQAEKLVSYMNISPANKEEKIKELISRKDSYNNFVDLSGPLSILEEINLPRNSIYGASGFRLQTSEPQGNAGTYGRIVSVMTHKGGQ